MSETPKPQEKGEDIEFIKQLEATGIPVEQIPTKEDTEDDKENTMVSSMADTAIEILKHYLDKGRNYSTNKKDREVNIREAIKEFRRKINQGADKNKLYALWCDRYGYPRTGWQVDKYSGQEIWEKVWEPFIDEELKK